MADRRPLTLLAEAAPARLQELPPGDLLPSDTLGNALKLVLSGLLTNNASGITADDTILQALGKLQGQVDKRVKDAPVDGAKYGRKNGGWEVLGSFADADYAGAPFINLIGDSGRFIGKTNPLPVWAAPFSATEFDAWMAPFNNRSPWVEAGKFIYDNTSFDGYAGELKPTVVDLLNAMGRSGGSSRWGVEFYVVESTSGATTDAASPIDNQRFLATVMRDTVQGIFCSNGYATFSSWFRVTSKSKILIGLLDSISFKNGVRQPTGVVTITAAEGWVHIRTIRRELMGYAVGFPYIYMEPSQKIQVALPAFYHGIVDQGLHSAPLLSIGR